MNTLIVTLDAVRRDHLAQYGYERETLPAAARLLDAGGIKFDQAVVNGTYTGISLPSLLTSRYLGDEAIRSGPTVGSALPNEIRTGGIHSNTFFSSKFDDVHGLDVYEDFAGQASHDDAIPTVNRVGRSLFDTVRPIVKKAGVFDLARRVQEAVLPASVIHEVAVFESAETTTDRALEFVRRSDDPFSLWVHYMDPHRPYAINADPPAYAPDLDRQEILDLMASAGVEPEQIDADQRELLVDLYDSAIRYTSRHVSRLFDGLETEGHWDDTAVILTADHGEEFGEHGLYFHRNRPYDELIRVPLFLRTPDDVPCPSQPVTEQRELLDVAPTVCRLHDTDPPESFLGTDLRSGGQRDVVTHGSFRDEGPVAAVRTDGWKYIDAGADTELYNLDTDPREQDNLSEKRRDQCRTYRSKVPNRLLEDADDGVPEDVDRDTRQRLEELGYLE